MMSKMLLDDFNSFLKDDTLLKEFRNQTTLVTGATGLIGSLLVKLLMYANSKEELNCTIIAIVRNVEKGKKIFSEYLFDDKLKISVCDLSKDICIDTDVDYIVHTAAVTKSKEMVQYPVDNIDVSINGTRNMLELARKKNVKGMVYLSSMEVYGQMEVSDHKISEHELGYIDLSAARSCYPEGKRMCECLCNAYACQYGVRVMSARLAQTFGPGIMKDEDRVFAQFAWSAIKGNDIVLHTKGESEGNYVYTMDAINAILLLLVKGESGQAYNVSNEDSHMTIAQMAQMVAEEITGGDIKVVFDIPENDKTFGYAPPTRMHLSNSKLKALGWVPTVSLKETYERMIEYLCE